MEAAEYEQPLLFGGSIIAMNAFPAFPKTSYVYLPGDGMEYRNSVLKQYQDYLISKGITDIELLHRAAAILVHENESLNPNRTHDNHLGFGICGRYTKIHFGVFKEKYPDDVTLEGQIRWCGDRFIHYLGVYGDMTKPHTEQMPDGRYITTTEGFFRLWVSHNCPACAAAGKNTTHLTPPYFQRVQGAYEKLRIQ